MTKPESQLDRVQLNNEWHARPVANMATPCRCTHQVIRRTISASDSRARFAQLCGQYAQAAPSVESRHHMVQMGTTLVKWEGHTGADSITHLIPGNANPLFSEHAAHFTPADLIQCFGDEIICGVHIEVFKQSKDDMDLETIKATLGSNEIFGGPIADGNAALWSSFRLDAEGYARIVMVDHSLPPSAVGRYLQRVVESESYRLQAMSALPLARQTMAALTVLEEELEPLMNQLTRASDDSDHERLLTDLSHMAARIEHLAAESSYRFAAARAYSQIVQQRLKELREERVLTQPRYSMFLQRTLQPAMRTCEAAERRIEELAQRVSRALTLLNSMVDMIQTRQTNAMMRTMSQNAQIQVRLQQAVEGFSTFVISYYALGILSYVLVGIEAAGYLPFDPKLILGATAPLLLASVWYMSRKLRKRLTGDLK